MQSILLTTQTVISVLLILIVLIQNKDEGFTSSGGGNSFTSTKRGPEKVIYIATYVLGGLFLLNALLFVFV